MRDTSLKQYLDEVTREVTPPVMSEQDTINQQLGRMRILTMRIPILAHWQLDRCARSVGKSKTALAQDLLLRAVEDAMEALQASGHLPSVIDLREAVDYYKASTKNGEPSDPGEPIEILCLEILPTDEVTA